MAEITLNMFDIIVLTVVGLSALLSFFRGFLREFFSLAGWAVAAAATLRFLKPATAYVRPHVGSDVVASGIASIGVFVITLVLVSILTGMILKFLKPAAKIGLFDNLAGLCFGVARGVLIIALGYFLMSVVIAEKDYPKWVREAYSRPYVAQAAKFIADLAPEYLDKIANKDESKRDIDEMMKGVDRTRDRVKTGADEAAKNIEDEANKIPSMQDLQRRIKEENERN